MRLLPEKSPQSDQILYLIKTTPSYFISVGQNFVFIQNAPPPLLQQKRLLTPWSTWIVQIMYLFKAPPFQLQKKR